MSNIHLNGYTHYVYILYFRKFKIIDDDGSKTIEYPEFKKAIQEFGLEFKEKEIKEIFGRFDEDGKGSIDFDEFLENLRVS